MKLVLKRFSTTEGSDLPPCAGCLACSAASVSHVPRMPQCAATEPTAEDLDGGRKQKLQIRKTQGGLRSAAGAQFLCTRPLPAASTAYGVERVGSREVAT